MFLKYAMESLDSFIEHICRERDRWEENPAHHQNLLRRYEELCAYHGCRPDVVESGFLEGAGPPKLASVDGHYDLKEVSQVHVKRFNVSAKRYDLQFQNMENVSDIEGVIEEVFDDVVKRIFDEPGNEADLIGVEVRFYFFYKYH